LTWLPEIKLLSEQNHRAHISPESLAFFDIIGNTGIILVEPVNLNHCRHILARRDADLQKVIEQCCSSPTTNPPEPTIQKLSFLKAGYSAGRCAANFAS